MKLLAIKDDGSTIFKDEVIGCYYPMGFVIQFNDENNLIDFITELPDDVWDYLGDSTTAVYFTKAYYFIYKGVQNV
nr:MAG: hypothetical protein [Microvirus Sku110]